MKTKILSLAIILCIFGIEKSRAQIDVFGKIKNKVDQRADQKVDQGIDKGLNKTEEGAKDATKKKDSDAKAGTEKTTDAKSAGSSTSATSASNPAALVSYGKYDFVPGDKVIFEDHVEGETLGEFPSKWDLRGGKIEVASFNGEQVIAFLEGNYASITPLMEKATDYLPDQFSIEFDHYVKGGYDKMALALADNQSKAFKQDELEDYSGWCLTVGQTGTILQASGQYPESAKEYFGKWHHIALSFNKGNVKIYADQFRLCNLPHSTGNPQQLVFGCIASEAEPVYIKNVRICAGGGDLYKRVTTDGKFITHGILFDVNKATIKPQSMGTLNDISKLMKDHPELKFEVDGHTDSDGEDAANMKLSNERAAAVKAQLVSMGVDASRLTTKGYGESKPLSDNTTPEGKANNRRVEFVKM